MLVCFYSDLGTNAWSLIIEKGNETHGMADIITGPVICASAGRGWKCGVCVSKCVCTVSQKPVHLRSSESFPQFSLCGTFQSLISESHLKMMSC